MTADPGNLDRFSRLARRRRQVEVPTPAGPAAITPSPRGGTPPLPAQLTPPAGRPEVGTPALSRIYGVAIDAVAMEMDENPLDWNETSLRISEEQWERLKRYQAEDREH